MPHVATIVRIAVHDDVESIVIMNNYFKKHINKNIYTYIHIYIYINAVMIVQSCKYIHTYMHMYMHIGMDRAGKASFDRGG
jgi:hypothetical protein